MNPHHSEPFPLSIIFRNGAVADVSEQGNQETARLIEEAGRRALAIRCDVTRTEDIENALNKGVEAFGRLDFAFNNAGIEQPVQLAAELIEEEWDRIMNIDLRGVFLCMKHEIPLMLKQGGGAIVNTSSGAGVKGIAGQAAYCAAKFGIVGLTKAAALDYVIVVKYFPVRIDSSVLLPVRGRCLTKMLPVNHGVTNEEAIEPGDTQRVNRSSEEAVSRSSACDKD